MIFIAVSNRTHKYALKFRAHAISPKELFRDRLQISLLILSNSKQINELLVLFLNLSEKQGCHQKIIKSEIWRRSLNRLLHLLFRDGFNLNFIFTIILFSKT